VIFLVPLGIANSCSGLKSYDERVDEDSTNLVKSYMMDISKGKH
jgi:hypothetical protein